MNCYIIGITGFLGQCLSKWLVRQGHYVAGCGSSSVNVSAQGIEYCCVDLSEETVAIPQGTDIVYYFAQYPHYRMFPKNANHLFAVNTFGAIKAAESAMKAGVKLFCFASTGNVYAPSFVPLSEEASVQRDNAYSLSKLMAEEALDLFSQEMDVVSVRIFGLFGPGQKAMLPYYLYNSVLKGENIFIQSSFDLPDDDGLQVSFAFCPDVVKILEKLAFFSLDGKKLPKLLNVGGEEAISIKRFAITIGETVGKKPRFVKKEDYREFNLIANIDLLCNLFSPDFTPFDEAVKQTFV